MAEPLTPAQRRTLPARQALAAKFSSPEEQSEHFRSLARRSHAGRVVLSAGEAAKLAQVSEFLRHLVERDRRADASCAAREEAAGVA